MSRSRSNVAGRVDPRIRQRDTPVGWTDRSALGLLPQMGQYQVKPGDKLTGGHGNGATMCLRNRFHDGKAKTGARRISSPCRINSVEAVEELW